MDQYSRNDGNDLNRWSRVGIGSDWMMRDRAFYMQLIAQGNDSTYTIRHSTSCGNAKHRCARALCLLWSDFRWVLGDNPALECQPDSTEKTGRKLTHMTRGAPSPSSPWRSLLDSLSKYVLYRPGRAVCVKLKRDVLCLRNLILHLHHRKPKVSRSCRGQSCRSTSSFEKRHKTIHCPSARSVSSSAPSHLQRRCWHSYQSRSRQKKSQTSLASHHLCHLSPGLWYSLDPWTIVRQIRCLCELRPG